jgi:hypothetical protein
MRRQPLLRHLWLALVVAACSPAGQPTLELSVGPARVDADVSIGITATAADGTPGQGSVAISTSLGTLAASTLMLAEGSGRTTLRCARSTAGCSAGAAIDVTARWTIPGGTVVTATRQVRLTDPPPPTDAGTQDAGAQDAGPGDAGAFDAGPEPDAGLVQLDAGTPLNLASPAIVLGPFGAPVTVGFSPLTPDAGVLLGFENMPVQTIIYGNRLLYVRAGLARVWEEDYVDGGPPRDAGFVVPVDAGAPDAGLDGGALDGGTLDGGRDGGASDAGPRDGGAGDGGAGDGGAGDGGLIDAGFDAGLPFILYAEANDPVFASCVEVTPNGDAGYLQRLLPTPSGRLWSACSLTAGAPVSLFWNGTDVISSGVAAVPLAAHENVILSLASDGSLLQLSTALPVTTPTAGRRFSRSARAVRGGFELLAFDPSVGRCELALVALGTGTVTVRALPASAPTGDACVEGVLSRTDDTAYFVVAPNGTDMAIIAVPLSSRSFADGGVVFAAGPPSDLLADPPVLSIDLTFPVQVVAP